MICVTYRIENSKKVYTIRLNAKNRLEAGVMLQRALRKRVKIIYFKEENNDSRTVINGT